MPETAWNTASNNNTHRWLTLIFVPRKPSRAAKHAICEIKIHFFVCFVTVLQYHKNHNITKSRFANVNWASEPRIFNACDLNGFLLNIEDFEWSSPIHFMACETLLSGTKSHVRCDFKTIYISIRNTLRFRKEKCLETLTKLKSSTLMFNFMIQIVYGTVKLPERNKIFKLELYRWNLYL